MISRLLALLVLLNFTMPAVPAVSVQMRDIGYTLGDLMTERVSISLPPGQEIDVDSLPALGRVTPWLELRKAELQQRQGSIKLDFEWQVFATVEHAAVLALPAIELHMRGDTPQVTTIPAQLFHLSPVLPGPLENSVPRPDLPPLLFDEHTPLTAALGFFALALFCLLAWLWVTDRIPGLPRHPGPFTSLARSLRYHKGELDLAVLQKIHATFNKVANETLYPATFPKLFEQAPYLAPIRVEMERFFRMSWKRFYESAPMTPSRVETLVWIKRAARAERLFRQ